MIHHRKDIIQRTIREYKRLNQIVAHLSKKDWTRLVPRPEAKDPWTIKDTLAHITHFKADAIRSIHRKPKPAELRALSISEENHLLYLRWRNHTPQEVLAWHRQVQNEVVNALKEVPDDWYSGRQRSEDWPFDLDGHSAFHRINDIEKVIKQHRQ
jgi:hypothetical protein